MCTFALSTTSSVSTKNRGACSRTMMFFRVTTSAEPSPTHQKQLEDLLRGALERTGHDFGKANGLEGLVEAAQVFAFKPPRSNAEVFKGFFKR